MLTVRPTRSPHQRKSAVRARPASRRACSTAAPQCARGPGPEIRCCPSGRSPRLHLAQQGLLDRPQHRFAGVMAVGLAQRLRLIDRDPKQSEGHAAGHHCDAPHPDGLPCRPGCARCPRLRRSLRGAACPSLQPGRTAEPRRWAHRGNCGGRLCAACRERNGRTCGLSTPGWACRRLVTVVVVHESASEIAVDRSIRNVQPQPLPSDGYARLHARAPRPGRCFVDAVQVFGAGPCDNSSGGYPVSAAAALFQNSTFDCSSRIATPPSIWSRVASSISYDRSYPLPGASWPPYTGYRLNGRDFMAIAILGLRLDVFAAQGEVKEYGFELVSAREVNRRLAHVDFVAAAGDYGRRRQRHSEERPGMPFFQPPASMLQSSPRASLIESSSSSMGRRRAWPRQSIVQPAR